MTFFRRILAKISYPITLLLVLAVFIGGFLLITALISLVAIYNYVTLNLIYLAPLPFLLRLYFKERKSMLSDEAWKIESRTILVLTLVLAFLVSLNYWVGFVTAPVVLFLYGLYFLCIAYLVSRDGRESAEKNASDMTYRLAPLSSKIPKWVIGNIVALLLLSGYWFTEIQKNEQISKDEGIQQALDLADYSVYFGPPSKASVRVDSIERVDFTKVDSSEEPGKHLEMCITIWLEASRDGYYFERLYPSEIVCVMESVWGSGWSDYDLEAEVKEVVRAKYE